MRVLVLMSNVEKRLGRDATHIEACAPERSSLFDASSLETKLGCLDGSNVASWATADDDHVEGRGEGAPSGVGERSAEIS